MRCIKVANTLEEKRLGLSVVPKLGENEYMLFIYEIPAHHTYWNKGVKYPIDIGFFDKDKKLIHKTSMHAEQRTPVMSPKPYSFVVETNKGKLDRPFAF